MVLKLACISTLPIMQGEG